MDQSIGARFWAKVNCAGKQMPHMETCCWEWHGSKNLGGYGRFKIKDKYHRAHALSLSWVLGHTPKYVMHKCDNPSCVRPSHLQEGNHGENMKDAYAKGRRPDCTRKGPNHPNAVFTAADIRDIRARYAAGETQKSIGASYGVVQSHISLIVLGKIYKTVSRAEAKVGDSWQEAK